MKQEITIDRIIGLIKNGSVSVESLDLIRKNISLIAAGKIEGGVVNSIEAKRVLDIYERRSCLAKLGNEILLGVDELLVSLKNCNYFIRPILISSKNYKITLFFKEDMSILVGAIFSVDPD